MNNIYLTEKEKFVSELCLRVVLSELLDKDPNMIGMVTGAAFNLNAGCFGNKKYVPSNANDWPKYLKEMRSIIKKLDPDFQKKREEIGCQDYILLEEEDVDDV